MASNPISRVLSKIPVPTTIMIISILSIISAIILLFSSSALYHTVHTYQNNKNDTRDNYDVLQQFFLHRLTPKEDLQIYGGIKLRHRRFFSSWEYLEDSVCKKFFLHPAYLFFTLCSIVLSLTQIPLTIWSAVPTFQKLAVNMVLSIWISRTLLPYLMQFSLTILLFVFSLNYRVSESQWVQNMEEEVTKQSGRLQQFNCHDEFSNIYLFAQAFNIYIVGLVGLLSILASFSTPGSCDSDHTEATIGKSSKNSESDEQEKMAFSPNQEMKALDKKSESFFSGCVVSQDEFGLNSPEGCKRRLSCAKNLY